jgi:hypothetical protein
MPVVVVVVVVVLSIFFLATVSHTQCLRRPTPWCGKVGESRNVGCANGKMLSIAKEGSRPLPKRHDRMEQGEVLVSVCVTPLLQKTQDRVVDWYYM